MQLKRKEQYLTLFLFYLNDLVYSGKSNSNEFSLQVFFFFFPQKFLLAFFQEVLLGFFQEYSFWVVSRTFFFWILEFFLRSSLRDILFWAFLLSGVPSEIFPRVLCRVPRVPPSGMPHFDNSSFWDSSGNPFRTFSRNLFQDFFRSSFRRSSGNSSWDCSTGLLRTPVEVLSLEFFHKIALVFLQTFFLQFFLRFLREFYLTAFWRGRHQTLLKLICISFNTQKMSVSIKIKHVSHWFLE